MSMEAAAPTGDLSPFEQLRYARQVILAESRILAQVANRLNGEFCRAIGLLRHCRGTIIVSGIGKAGLIGQKIMATLASTGAPAHYLHPAEAVHGDLGRVRPGDVMLVLSQSGETAEVTRLLPSLAELGIPIVAITARYESTLGRAAAVTIELGTMEEAGDLGLAPSNSTTAMLAIGDALALVLSRMRQFSRDDFARFHPAGNLGYKLSKVEQHMRPLDQCRIAHQEETLREVLVKVSMPGRRTGATMLIDDAGTLAGIFTDSDLARLFERRKDQAIDQPIREVMTHRPLRVETGSMMADAVAMMAERKISELPVVNAEHQPVGLIDVTDVVALLPQETSNLAEQSSTEARPIPGSRWRVVGEPVDDAAG
jgi:arabinose-5-phosphate isomerase